LLHHITKHDQDILALGICAGIVPHQLAGIILLIRVYSLDKNWLLPVRQ
jgi:hypothetical protein